MLNASARSSSSTSYAYATPHGGSSGGAPVVNAINTFRRSRDDRWIGGVCGGLAGSAAWRRGSGGSCSWRSRPAPGGGVLLYLLLWIFVPLED